MSIKNQNSKRHWPINIKNKRRTFSQLNYILFSKEYQLLTNYYSADTHAQKLVVNAALQLYQNIFTAEKLHAIFNVAVFEAVKLSVLLLVEMQ